MTSSRIPYSTIRFNGRKLSFMSKYIEECFLRFLTGVEQLQALTLINEFHKNKLEQLYNNEKCSIDVAYPPPPSYEMLQQTPSTLIRNASCSHQLNITG